MMGASTTMKSNSSMEPSQPPLGSGRALSAVTLTTRTPRISSVRFQRGEQRSGIIGVKRQAIEAIGLGG